LTWREARHELPLFDGFRQYHIARQELGEELTWPEVEEREIAQARAELRALTGA
jgi:hypothetical protein